MRRRTVRCSLPLRRGLGTTVRFRPDTTTATRQLVDAACTWLESEGAEAARAGFGLLDFPFPIDAYDALPPTWLRQSPAYYHGLLKDAGFETEQGWVDYRIEVTPELVARWTSALDSARRAGFGSKLAWLAKPGQPLIFAGRDDDDARQAAELASAVGLRDVAGVLAGGMTSWREERLPVETVQRMTVDELERAWGEGVQLLDVRELAEWDEGHVPGSIHTPYHDIDDIPNGIDQSRPVAVMCNSGPRAAVAASLLKRLGLDNVIHVVDGGVKDLLARGAPAA